MPLTRRGPLRLSQAGSKARLAFLFVAEPPRGRRVDDHTHEALELVYYADGEGDTTVGGVPCRIVRNTVTITPAGAYHDQYSKTDITAICLGITNSGLEDLQGGYLDRHGLLRRPLDRLLHEMEREDVAFETVCTGLVLEIVGFVRRVASAVETSKPGKEALVERALDLIQDHDGGLSVRQLSEKLYVSRDYLRHLVTEYTSRSPLRHIIDARIEKAKDLLGDEELTIAQVGERCGLLNPYYFSRLFKQVTGKTPSQFRARLGG